MKDIWTLLQGELTAIVIAGTAMEAREIARLFYPEEGWESAEAIPQGVQIDTVEGLIFHGRRV